MSSRHRKAIPWVAVLALHFSALTHGETFLSEDGLRSSDPLLYAHVVIECTIKTLVTKQVTLEDLGVLDMPGVETLVKEAEYADLKVLRGIYEGNSILIDLNALESIHSKTLVGTRVILCGTWKPKMGQYVVRSSRAVLVETESGWQRLYASDTVSRARIDQLLQSIRPDIVAAQADVALIGGVLSCERRRVEFRSGRHAEVWSVTLGVQRKLKGNVPEGKVSFILLISGDYVPEWRGEDPKKFVTGESWLVFLSERDGFLVPVSGKNGLLLIDGDQLTYDRAVRYPLSLSRFQSIAMEAEDEN